jgi:Protein of unknown function (DUF3551)
MRTASALFIALIVASAIEPVQADPYRYCASYGMGFGAEGCYYVTEEQCRASVSGMGGFCRLNNFYDGRPVMTPADGPARRKSRS